MSMRRRFIFCNKAGGGRKMNSGASSMPNRFIQRFTPSFSFSSSSSSPRSVGLNINKHNNGDNYPLSSPHSNINQVPSLSLFFPIMSFYLFSILCDRVLPLLPMSIPNLMSSNSSKLTRFNFSLSLSVLMDQIP